MTEFIYVICEAQDPTCVKIGLSRDPDRRVRQLQTGWSQPLVVFHREEIPDGKVRGLEKLIHRLLAHLRLQGEWFELTPEAAVLEVRHALMRYGDEEDVSLRLRGGTFSF